MPKGSLYAAHRAAGAASGRYKASLYDVANVGYEMEAEVGLEQFRQGQTQETFATIGEALSLAETIRGTFASKKKHEELMGDTEPPKPEKATKEVPTVEVKSSVTKKLEDMPAGSQERIEEYQRRGWAMDETTKAAKRYAAGAPGTGEIKKPIKQKVHIPTLDEAQKALKGRKGRKFQKEMADLFGDDFSNYGFQ